MRLLLTGCPGFVSHHFLDHLDESQVDAEVLGVGRRSPSEHKQRQHIRFRWEQLDMLDRARVDDVLARFRPTHIVHLAASSSVGLSWEQPVESFTNNTNILLNLLEQIRKLSLPCRVLSVGSSEQYGKVSVDDLPLTEEGLQRPVSPYGVARVAQEMLSGVYVAGYDLDIVMTRSFNHIGTFQRAQFVVPSIARQLIAIRDRGAPPRLRTGDCSVVRDFVDVRDVSDAYLRLLLNGTSGQTYNICSGRGVTVESLIQMMQSLANTDAVLVSDPSLYRPTDNPQVVGSNEKIRSSVGWAPRFSLEDSLASILGWWAEQN